MRLMEPAIVHDRPWSWDTVWPWLAALGLIQMVAAIAAIQLGALWMWAPAAVLVASIAFLSPRLGVYFLVVLVYVRVPLSGAVGVYPADIVAILILAGAAVGHLAANRQPSEVNPLTKPTIAVLGVFALSLVSSKFLNAGVVNWMRHAQILGLSLAVTASLDRRDVHRLLRGMFIITTAMAAYNAVRFILIGGTARLFGPLGAFFPLFLSVAIGYGTVFFLIVDDTRTRVTWGAALLILFMGQLSSQARAAWLQTALSIGLLAWVFWKWAGNNGFPAIRRRLRTLGIVAFVVALVLLSGAIPLFDQPTSRVYESLAGESLSLNMRFFLWKMGMDAFLASPLLGTGLAAVRHLDELLPQWRLETMGLYTHGLGAHNDMITYLSETGLIGVTVILWLFLRVLRVGYQAFRARSSVEDAAAILSLWIPVSGIVMAFFFGAHTFYSIAGLMTSLCFGMLVRLCLPQSPTGAQRGS
ncbi:MAG: O-antigen ligase family protein [Candidatus Zixiibacteriota bacterium]